MQLKYITITVSDINEQVDFYIDKLGFRVNERACFSAGKKYAKLTGPSGQTVLMIFEENRDLTFKSTVILNTSDFLTDHYKLKEKGIQFLTEPEYLHVGLAAGFNDPADNYWLLLEERDYSDL